MPRILFLTYFYSPCNATASNRPNSFVRNFLKHGFEVTLITRHWTGNEKVWADYLKADDRPVEVKKEKGLEVHYLPYKSFEYSKWVNNTLWQNLKGNFNYESAYGQFEEYIATLLEREKFDYILASTPPLTVLKTAAHLAKRFKIPLIADIRDFENDILLYKKKEHNWMREQRHRILERHLKVWMKEAAVVCTASPPLTDYFKEKTSPDAFTLNNGFNEELLEMNEQAPADWFTITVTGTLYEMANLKVMLDTCELLVAGKKKIKFQFIGLLANEAVADMFRKIIPTDQLVLTHRIPQQQAFHAASASNVLMLAGFDTMKGAYTTKVFEYLGLRRNILQIPGDRDVVEELVKYTESGKTPHTAEEASAVVTQWYDEWANTGSIRYSGNMTRIKEYSREKQFERLLARITR